MLKKLVLILGLVPVIAFSQYTRLRYKYELIGGTGVANFLGDLGGADQIGTHFLKDFEFKGTRPTLSAGIRYKTSPYYAFKSTLAFAMVAGKDSWTQDIYRNNRNLSFRSPIIELSVQAEGYFLREKTGRVYKISGVRGKRNRKTTAYFFAGVGVFFYCPSAQDSTGKWRHLRKLHTEGQGLPGGPKQYSNFSLCFPGGIGIKYNIDKRWSVGGEFGIRKTFTDYIDDVSGTYYDNAAIKQAYGPIAAQLADPSLGYIYGATLPGGDGPAQRGQPKYKDTYMLLDITVSYKFSKRKRTRSKF